MQFFSKKVFYHPSLYQLLCDYYVITMRLLCDSATLLDALIPYYFTLPTGDITIIQ